ncbi:MAG: tetratricopeptide repeat protein [Nitrospirota bacterium]
MNRVRFFVLAVLLGLLTALSFFRSAVYENEITLYTDVTRKSPAKARPYNNLGESLRKAGRMDEALRCFETALALKPDYADALNNIATIYRNRGNREQALAIVQQALAIDPLHVQARFNLAMYYYEAGLFSDAEREFQTLIRIDRSSSEAAFAGKMLDVIRSRSPDRRR